MELFEFLRGFYRKLGVIPPQSPRIGLFGWKTLSISLAPVYFSASSLVSMSLQINTAPDFFKVIIDLGYWAVSGFQCALVFAITISKMPNMMKVIESFEEIIRNSKCQQRIRIARTNLFLYLR